MENASFDPNFSLSGRIALVTGAARGIGAAIADLFAAKGACVVLSDRSPAVQERQASLRDAGHQAFSVTADLTVGEELDAMVNEVHREHGRIDLLVNSAGVVHLEEAENLSESAWDQTMEINLKAVFRLSQAVGRIMIAQGGGKIINLASQAGLVALDRHLAYCASKAAVIAVTRSLALEWGKYNLQVNSISPTVILTELGQKAWAGEVGERMKEKIPARRFGRPEEVAAAAVYLASDAANLITGENLVIDGGYTVQ